MFSGLCCLAINARKDSNLGHLIPVTHIVALSIAVQSAAAVMAFRLIAVTERKTAWLIISLALTLSLRKFR